MIQTSHSAERHATPMGLPFRLHVSGGTEVHGLSATISTTALLTRDHHGALRAIVRNTAAQLLPGISSAADWTEFQGYVEQWKAESAYLSMVEEMVLLEPYQKIIGMGRKALPLIMKQLENEGSNPDHWWWALRILARHDPVPPQHAGNVPLMAKYWLEWLRGSNQLAG